MTKTWGKRCPECNGVGRHLVAGSEARRPNGTIARTFPHWVDCAACGGTGEAS